MESRCTETPDGEHDWGGFDRTLCYCEPGGVMHTYCVACGLVDSPIEHS